MIKEFETMFPRCLFVAKNTNYKELTEKFKIYYPTSEEENKEDERDFNASTFSSNINATVYLVKDKISEHFGYLVILNSDKFDAGECTHEGTHICKHMEDYFGLESSSNEYRAYTTEWYANKIAEVWNLKEEKNATEEAKP